MKTTKKKKMSSEAHHVTHIAKAEAAILAMKASTFTGKVDLLNGLNRVLELLEYDLKMLNQQIKPALAAARVLEKMIRKAYSTHHSKRK